MTFLRIREPRTQKSVKTTFKLEGVVEQATCPFCGTVNTARYSQRDNSLLVTDETCMHHLALVSAGRQQTSMIFEGFAYELANGQE